MCISAKSMGTVFLAATMGILMNACSSGVEALQALDRPMAIERFMGDWYVVGSIPIDLPFASEAGAHNAVESYSLNDDGSIDTRYRFRKDSFDGPVKQFNPTGFVYNTETNTEWRMQFLWPFKSSYLIVYLADDYSRTIIGVPNRKYIWIMSRTPAISDTEYDQLLSVAAGLGYDTESIVRIPQQWPEPATAAQ